MYENLKKTVRSCASIQDWNPSDLQLSAIKTDILNAVNAGRIITKSECQRIVCKYCGNIRVLVNLGVDNSDLNALLISAIKRDSK